MWIALALLAAVVLARGRTAASSSPPAPAPSPAPPAPPRPPSGAEIARDITLGALSSADEVADAIATVSEALDD